MISTSFSGHILKSGKLLRFLYLDESGTSYNEPHSVVAGVIIHADDQLKKIQYYIEYLQHKFSKDDKRLQIHMKDIWSGNKQYATWTRTERYDFIKEILEIVPRINIPIVYGHVEKQHFEKILCDCVLDKKKITDECQVAAYRYCLAAADQAMHTMFDDEVMQVVAENQDSCKRHIEKMHFDMQNYSESPFTPLRHIVNSVLWSGKDCSATQLADSIAFFIRGFLDGRNDIEEFYDIFKSFIVSVGSNNTIL